MFDSWVCLSVSKGPGVIDEQIKAVMKRAACSLHRDKKDRKLFTSDICSGLIETAWKSATLGAQTGIIFHIEVENDDGLWQVNFMMNTKDLERGAAIIDELGDASMEGEWRESPTDFPVPELYHFKDLSSHHRN